MNPGLSIRSNRPSCYIVPLNRIESLKTKLQYLVGALLFFGLLGFIEYYIGWKRLLAPWATLSMGALLTAAGITFVSYWLRAVRLFDYFRADMRGGFPVCFKLMLQHNLLNNLLQISVNWQHREPPA